MKKTLLLFSILFGPIIESRAATPLDAQAQRVQALVATHRGAINRLTPSAVAVEQALAKGGALYLAGGNNAWLYEGLGRSGGLMKIDLLPATSNVRATDVVWIVYSAATYQAAINIQSQIAPTNCLIVAFGPQLPTGPPASAMRPITQISTVDGKGWEVGRRSSQGCCV